MEYGLIGEKLSHSYSVEIHAQLAPYHYTLCELSAGEVAGFFKRREFLGVNVTIPYKGIALECCDDLSDEAKRLMSVNTVVREADGRLTGHNTDYFGFCEMVKKSGLNPRGQKVALLGARGGAGRTAMAALMDMGAKVVPVSRSGPIDADALYRDHEDTAIVVNATPVGMYPNLDESPVDVMRLPMLKGVLDMVYNPHRTRLLQDARGMIAMNGLYMLIRQAARAKELFTGEVAQGIDEIYRKLAADKLNAVLIGMPGSGKTAIGRALAARMGRAFVDIDSEIAHRAGKAIPEIFALDGEAAFRALEREAIAAALGMRGAVIATGGGAVLNPLNVRALSQNGVLIYAQRALEELATEGRPLSVDLAALFSARDPIYRAAAHVSILNDTSIDAAAIAAQEGFYEAAGD